MKLIVIDTYEEKERVLKIIEVSESYWLAYWTSGKGNCVEKPSGKPIADSQCCVVFTTASSSLESEFRRKYILCEKERSSICYRDNNNEIDDDYNCDCEL